MNWTEPADLVDKLSRRWQTGQFLTAVGRGQAFIPLSFPVHGPAAREIGERVDAVRLWICRWEKSPFRVQSAAVGGRSFGTNVVPRRAWVDNLEDVARIVGAGEDLPRFTQLAASSLGDWVIDHPIRALQHEAVWERLCSSVTWLRANAGTGLYLRQVDADGVDTKFVERHRAILGQLLGEPGFESRFRQKPKYIRMRLMGVDVAGLSEVTVRADEIALHPKRVIIVENEVSYLAFPHVNDTVLIFGGGYGVSTVGGLEWIAAADLYYWSDIDTHGFQMLSRLRTVFPHARSLLMDRRTLLDHEPHWTDEPVPVNATLPGLKAAEAALYRDLVEDTLGRGVRLEQERVRFSAIHHALARVGLSAGG